MEQEKRILDEVERTMRALDDLPNLEANPFLYARIKAALDRGTTPGERSLAERLRLKPVALALLIVFNLFSAIYFMKSSRHEYSRAALISSLNKEYNSDQEDFMVGN